MIQIQEMKKSQYAMCYFHIGDLVTESNGMMDKYSYEAYFKEPGTLKARYIRYIKSNLGMKNAFDKMVQLIGDMDFVGLEQADETMVWKNTVEVRL